MVSLQAAFSSSSSEAKKPCLAIANPVTKKRKREVDDEAQSGTSFLAMAPEKPQLVGIELNLDTPLPSEWQRCLDIKSGQIHYYNTRTQKRTSKDPSRDESLEPNSNDTAPNLDLELNLTLEPSKPRTQKPKLETNYSNDNFLSSVSVVASNHQEMVAAVCMQCHMLVMMCRANPSCPNCKFVYPPSRSSSSAPLKPAGFELLCCKD